MPQANCTRPRRGKQKIKRYPGVMPRLHHSPFIQRRQNIFKPTEIRAPAGGNGGEDQFSLGVHDRKGRTGGYDLHLLTAQRRAALAASWWMLMVEYHPGVMVLPGIRPLTHVEPLNAVRQHNFAANGAAVISSATRFPAIH